MKIQVLSDLHQEFGSSELDFSQADLVVFAGDTNLGITGIDWIKSRVTDIPVIYILGNHEYYKGSYPGTLSKITAAAASTNIHVLENKAVEFDGITFHGCTLWTDFELYGNPGLTGSICQQSMNDYRMIRKDPAYSRLRSVDTYNIHKASLSWLKQSLEWNSERRNIVITHHAPSFGSIPEENRDDPVSSAYASDLEEVILKYQPEYWIHGHIHKSFRYKVGNTTVLCNPHGYIHERNAQFNPSLLLGI